MNQTSDLRKAVLFSLLAVVLFCLWLSGELKYLKITGASWSMGRCSMEDPLTNLEGLGCSSLRVFLCVSWCRSSAIRRFGLGRPATCWPSRQAKFERESPGLTSSGGPPDDRRAQPGRPAHSRGRGARSRPRTGAAAGLSSRQAETLREVQRFRIVGVNALAQSRYPGRAGELRGRLDRLVRRKLVSAIRRRLPGQRQKLEVLTLTPKLQKPREVLSRCRDLRGLPESRLKLHCEGALFRTS